MYLWQTQDVRWANILPVKWDIQETQSLVTICPTEQISKNIDNPRGGILRCQAEHTDTVKQWEDISRQHFVKEHSREGYPKELDTLPVRSSVKVQSWETNINQSTLTCNTAYWPWKTETVGKFWKLISGVREVLPWKELLTNQ